MTDSEKREDLLKLREALENALIVQGPYWLCHLLGQIRRDHCTSPDLVNLGIDRPDNDMILAWWKTRDYQSRLDAIDHALSKLK